MNTKIGFKSMMFVYCAEEAYNPSKLKVFVPDVFLTGNSPGLSETKSQKGNTSIFVNATIPALSPYATKYNYITLPIIRDNNGWVRKGERFMAEFVNDNPKYGIIVARC